MKRWLKLFALALVMVPAVFGVMLGGDTDSATSAVYTQYTITDNATGGDCSVIGTWDSATKTCTLTRDLYVPGINGIKISGSGITLDGAGHILDGENGFNTGVETSVYSGIRVINFKFQNFHGGIFGGGTSSSTFSGNSFSNMDYAISLIFPASYTIEHNTGNEISNGITVRAMTGTCTIQHNTFDIQDGGTGISVGGLISSSIFSNQITGGNEGIEIYGEANIQNNHISSCTGAGIIVSDSDKSILVNNVLVSNVVGLDASSITNAQIVNNYFMQNRDLGLTLTTSSNNLILNNNFLNNGNVTGRQVAVSGGSGNIFSTDTYGGNYWEGNEWPQPCSDTDNNGYCDSTYTFTGGQDSLPWVKSGGWGPDLEIDISGSTADWASYSDYLDGILTYTFKIRNNGKIDASNAYIDSVHATNAVEQLNPTPVLIAKNLGVGASTSTITLKYKVPAGITSFRTSIDMVCWDSTWLIYYISNVGNMDSDNKA
jgi:parallel beta-helix repeat protein